MRAGDPLRIGLIRGCTKALIFGNLAIGQEVPYSLQKTGE